jgi:hypothetical protein
MNRMQNKKEKENGQRQTCFSRVPYKGAVDEFTRSAKVFSVESNNALNTCTIVAQDRVGDQQTGAGC